MTNTVSPYLTLPLRTLDAARIDRAMTRIREAVAASAAARKAA
jgi:hypothetical protein